MKDSYDFSKGKRGAVVKKAEPRPGKTRITIRIDNDVLDWFLEQVDKAGGGNYQTMINDVLSAHVKDQSPALEAILRRVIREEMKDTAA